MPAESPERIEQRERNAFMENLAPAAKERFLEALELAAQQGSNEDAAWQSAAVAAQLAYHRA